MRSSLRGGVIAVLVAAWGLAACSGGSSHGSGAGVTVSAATPAVPPLASTEPSGTATGSATGTATRWPITLAFGGDVHFTDYVAGLLRDPSTSLADLRPYLSGADVAMVNFETAVTSRGTPAPKDFHFRTTPEALTALQDVGVDVVTMANNHAVDYGEAGLKDTLAAVGRSSVRVVGIGADAAQAYAPAMLEVRGAKVAVLGASQLGDWTLSAWSATANRAGIASAATLDRLTASVRRARSQADVVVVYLHWGTDYTTCPTALQRRTAEALSAAGADVIVGSHAHRLQAGGWLGGSYVDYGLGNFIWWRSRGLDATTGVLTLTVDQPAGASRAGVTKASFAPLTIAADGVPRAGSAQATSSAQAAWKQLRGCSGLSAAPSNG